MDIDEMQDEVGEWAEENFGHEEDVIESIRARHYGTNDRNQLGPALCVLGVHEESGELTTSVLKRAQGIGDSEKYSDREEVGDEAEMDAVGDIIIYLMDFCHRRGYDISDCLEMAWNDDVSQREWDANTAHND